VTSRWLIARYNLYVYELGIQIGVYMIQYPSFRGTVALDHDYGEAYRLRIAVTTSAIRFAARFGFSCSQILMTVHPASFN
jgi:hypothetical protein